MAEYVSPPGIDRRGTIGPQERRRAYYPERGLVEDFLSGRNLALGAGGLEAVIAESVEAQLLSNARGLLTS